VGENLEFIFNSHQDFLCFVSGMKALKFTKEKTPKVNEFRSEIEVKKYTEWDSKNALEWLSCIYSKDVALSTYFESSFRNKNIDGIEIGALNEESLKEMSKSERYSKILNDYKKKLYEDGGMNLFLIGSF
jgi:hypothetical protein